MRQPVPQARPSVRLKTAQAGRFLFNAGCLVAFISLAIDQTSKWFILTYVMNPPRTISVTPFFNLTLGFNTGVSFGVFRSGAEITQWILSGLALVVVAWLLVWLRRSGNVWEAMAIGAIIGGALGNVVDRVRQGAVTDFLDFHAAGYHWPTFNLADTAISVGVMILIASALLSKRSTSAA